MKDLLISTVVGILLIAIAILVHRCGRLDRLATVRGLALHDSAETNARIVRELTELRGIIKARENDADQTVEHNLRVTYPIVTTGSATWPPSADSLARRLGAPMRPVPRGLYEWSP